MPVQKWTCEKCGKSYDTLEEASRCEQRHKPTPSTSKQTATSEIHAYQNIQIILEPKQDDPEWGAHINVGTRNKRERCPDWCKPNQYDDWRARGVIIWNKSIKEVTKLEATDAIQVLDYLRANGTELGVVVGMPRTRLPLNRRDSKPKQVITNEIPLDSTQAEEILEFLQSNEPLLQPSVEADKRQEARLLASVYGYLLETAARKKAEERQNPKS